MRDSNASGNKSIKEVEKLRARKAKLARVSSEPSKHKKVHKGLEAVRTAIKAGRKTEIGILGDILQGMHLCRFYQVV